MISDHAIVEREGFKVPLIGIPKAAMLEECDLCHQTFPLREMEIQPSGQELCPKCRATISASLQTCNH